MAPKLNVNHPFVPHRNALVTEWGLRRVGGTCKRENRKNKRAAPTSRDIGAGYSTSATRQCDTRTKSGEPQHGPVLVGTVFYFFFPCCQSLSCARPRRPRPLRAATHDKFDSVGHPDCWLSTPRLFQVSQRWCPVDSGDDGVISPLALLPPLPQCPTASLPIPNESCAK